MSSFRPTTAVSWPLTPSAEPPSAGQESRALGRLRWRIARTLVRQTFHQNRFRLVLVVLLSLALWFGLWWLFRDVFHFLRTTITLRETYDQTVRGLFGLFFASLMAMLLFSAGIILYSLLFRSREVSFLLTLPIRSERIFLHKFQEAVLFSSWGFLLLGSPMLLAYGVVAEAGWLYYAILLPLMAAFVYIPSAIASIFCLAVLRWLPGHRLLLAIVIGLLLLLAMAGGAWSLLGRPEGNLLTPAWFQEVLGRLQLTEQRLLPSWWLSVGLLEAARDQRVESLMFVALMVSNALFFRQIAIGVAGRLYRPALEALSRMRVPPRQAFHSPVLERFLHGVTWPLPREIRLLLVKDLRLFHRDPVQWSQFLVFFGLLALYFVNVRRLHYDVFYAGWVNLVSFLNLAVVGLLLSTFNTRFVFPMLSLEARRFWILGLLPVGRETILWSKFVFAALGSVIPSSVLIFLSDLMLGVNRAILVSHQLTCVLLSVGLAGIAVGLGARLPSLREQSPSRIAAGFGGTLNLVISTLYILAVVLLTALPCHFYHALQGTGGFLARRPPLADYLSVWFLAGNLASIALAVLATAVPLGIGLKAFRRWEF